LHRAILQIILLNKTAAKLSVSPQLRGVGTYASHLIGSAQSTLRAAYVKERSSWRKPHTIIQALWPLL